jgi:plasmid stabilization system protein ParE
MKVRLTATAVAELDRILAHIADDNPVAAGRVAAAIERTFGWIGRWPLMSPVVHGGDVRSKLVLEYQLRVFYMIREDEIIVRNIRSTRQLRPWERPPA